MFLTTLVKSSTVLQTLFGNNKKSRPHKRTLAHSISSSILQIINNHPLYSQRPTVVAINHQLSTQQTQQHDFTLSSKANQDPNNRANHHRTQQRAIYNSKNLVSKGSILDTNKSRLDLTNIVPVYLGPLCLELFSAYIVWLHTHDVVKMISDNDSAIRVTKATMLRQIEAALKEEVFCGVVTEYLKVLYGEYDEEHGPTPKNALCDVFLLAERFGCRI